MWGSISSIVSSKYGRIFSIVAWLFLPIMLFLYAPSLTEISSSSQEDFLPVGVESTKAIEIQERHFPSQGIPGILIYKNSNGFSADDFKNIEQEFLWLQDRSIESEVLGEVNSIFNNPGLRTNLVSTDNTTMMLFFTLLSNEEVEIEEVQSEVRLIRKQLIQDRNDDVEVWLTGAAGVLEDAVSVFQSIDTTITLITVVLVLTILLIIYKAPILAILPVLSAGFAYLVASAIVALLAKNAGLVVNAQATSIMVVLIFGAGTDYMLFISSRFKEYLRTGSGSIEGISETMNRIGPAIFSSAVTTILAMLALLLATSRSFQVLGPILALGMTVAILSGLTFIPAVLSLLGKKAYWPTKIVQSDSKEHKLGVSEKFWGKVGSLVAARPFFTMTVSVMLLLFMSLGTLTLKPSFDLRASLPDESESVSGFEVLQDSFPSGNVYPTSVFVILNDDVFDNLKLIEEISTKLTTVDTVVRVSGPSRPFGSKLEIPIDVYYESFQDLPEELQESIPIVGSKELRNLGTSEKFDSAELSLIASYATTFDLISKSGNVARLEVVFQGDPGSLEVLERIPELRAKILSIENEFIEEVLVGGSTAIQYDTKVANERDIKLIAPIVLLVIFVVLAILVRALIAPLYLLGSVLLSFLGSLGISTLIFQNILGHDGIGSGVPIYMFLFLVALGVDYNIYIISRVKEESQTYGIKEGTRIAVSSTGGVITSAGIILAATFGALAILPLRDLLQLGFVVSFGVLLDTFFVRGFMVPSLVMICGEWSWWPFNKKISGQPISDRVDN
jgi:RND superfamily putative drug exporter